MNGDKLIRIATAGVVTCVAGFAAVVSYSHIYDLGRDHGQAGTAARLLPLSVDGLILAASLVLLHEARNQRAAPPLARWMLIAGVGATVAANALYGLRFGVLGAVISAWPAAAFIGAVEMLMGLVRRTRSVQQQGPALSAVPADVYEAAKASYAATVAAGNALTQNQLMTRFALTRSQAMKVRRDSNGHAPVDDLQEVMP